MAERSSIFQEEWRKCLNEHYKYVIREDDKVTERTLTPILHRIGYTDDDLQRLYMEATMRAEDLPDDFLPDRERALATEETTALEPSFKVHPAECQCAACMDDVLEIGHDDDGQPLAHPPEPEEAEGNVFAVAKPGDDAEDDPDKPKQMSMF